MNTSWKSFRPALRTFRKEIGLGVILGLSAWGMLILGASLAVPRGEHQAELVAAPRSAPHGEPGAASQRGPDASGDSPRAQASSPSPGSVEPQAPRPAQAEATSARDEPRPSETARTANAHGPNPVPPPQAKSAQATPPASALPARQVSRSVLIPEQAWFASDKTADGAVPGESSPNAESSPDPAVAELRAALATARTRQLPILFLLHGKRSNQEALSDWQNEINRGDRPQLAQLKRFADIYVVIAWPWKDSAALAAQLQLRPFATHDHQTPQFVIARCDGRQLSSVSSWKQNDPLLLLYSLAQGVVQEAKERTRSPEQLHAVLELVAPIDDGLASQVKRLLAGTGDARAAGPEMFAVDPLEGPAGQHVHIKGSGFKHTREVLFFTNFNYKSAKFNVISETELEVTAPDYWSADTRAAIAVWTANGITVGLPPDTLRVNDSERLRAAATYEVLQGGHIASAMGTFFVHDGGSVVQCPQAHLCFVAKGGALESFQNPAGVVFHEPGAILGTGMKVQRGRNGHEGPTLTGVPEVIPSAGIGPFAFQSPPAPDVQPHSVPSIKSIVPAVAYPGDIIAVHGRGFEGTDQVYVAGGTHRSTHVAAFRVESDQVLKVQVPDHSASMQYVIIVNPLGAAVTVPHESFQDAKRNTPHLRIVRAGQTVSKSVNEQYFVEKGGIVEHKTSLAFVQKGGRLVDLPEVLFFEPGAFVPASSEQQKENWHEVPRLELSPIHTPLYVMTAQELRSTGAFPRPAIPARRSP